MRREFTQDNLAVLWFCNTTLFPISFHQAVDEDSYAPDEEADKETHHEGRDSWFFFEIKGIGLYVDFFRDSAWYVELFKYIFLSSFIDKFNLVGFAVTEALI